MTKKTRTGEYAANKSLTKSIRFKKIEYEGLVALAKTRGVDFSVMLRDLIMTQLSNAAEHEELLGSFKSAKPEEIQKNFFDILNKSEEVLLKTITNNNEMLRRKIEFHEKLIRGLMFLVIYFNREMDDAEKEGRAANAKKRLKAFIQSLEKEHS